VTTTTLSPMTERARDFVAERSEAALALGRGAGDLVHDPAALVERLRDGLAGLADPEYHEGASVIVPGIEPFLGVRQPLLGAVSRGLRSAMRRDRASTRLDVAAALLREPLAELRWLAIDLLEGVVVAEPELGWQLIRATSRSATEWVTVDRLARPVGLGILAEPYRWAELEQLVYSPSRWERRLVGSTIATLPHLGRDPEQRSATVRRGLRLLADLIGDADPDVQKALSWALRTLASLDLPATTAFLRAEAATARATDDGSRAWVIRDTFAKLPAPLVGELRATLDGIRRRAGAPSTSRARATAAAFIGLGVDVPPAERATIDRG
jgi:3-methyladenine DNA glycosylase AlkD